jgi:hypothetical protein|tara:strand:+ start:143 stop:424 length:282 start_codon:yes stop_codon:yes gene_type:complete
METIMKKWNIILVGLTLTIVFAPDVRADPLKNPMPWLVPQIYSATVGPIGGGYTPTDFAIARGDIRSVPKIRILQDVLRKAGVDITHPLRLFR